MYVHGTTPPASAATAVRLRGRELFGVRYIDVYQPRARLRTAKYCTRGATRQGLGWRVPASAKASSILTCRADDRKTIGKYRETKFQR